METRYRRQILGDKIKKGEDISKYDERAIRVGDFLVGRPDGENSKEVIEIKQLSKWKHAIGQVLVYSIFTGKRPKLVLLEDKPMKKESVQVIEETCSALGIDVEVREYNDVREYTKSLSLDWRQRAKKQHLASLCPEGKSQKKEVLCHLVPIDAWRDMNLEGLKYLAKQYAVKGFSKMNKSQLIEELSTLINETCASKTEKYSIHTTTFDSPKKVKRRITDKEYFEEMTIPQLREYAKEKGVELKSKLRKAEIIQLILNSE